MAFSAPMLATAAAMPFAVSPRLAPWRGDARHDLDDGDRERAPTRSETVLAGLLQPARLRPVWVPADGNCFPRALAGALRLCTAPTTHTARACTAHVVVRERVSREVRALVGRLSLSAADAADASAEAAPGAHMGGTVALMAAAEVYGLLPRAQHAATEFTRRLVVVRADDSVRLGRLCFDIDFPPSVASADGMPARLDRVRDVVLVHWAAEQHWTFATSEWYPMAGRWNAPAAAPAAAPAPAVDPAAGLGQQLQLFVYQASAATWPRCKRHGVLAAPAKQHAAGLAAFDPHQECPPSVIVYNISTHTVYGVLSALQGPVRDLLGPDYFAGRFRSQLHVAALSPGRVSPFVARPVADLSLAGAVRAAYVGPGELRRALATHGVLHERFVAPVLALLGRSADADREAFPDPRALAVSPAPAPAARAGTGGDEAGAGEVGGQWNVLASNSDSDDDDDGDSDDGADAASAAAPAAAHDPPDPNGLAAACAPAAAPTAAAPHVDEVAVLRSAAATIPDKWGDVVTPEPVVDGGAGAHGPERCALPPPAAEAQDERAASGSDADMDTASERSGRWHRQR